MAQHAANRLNAIPHERVVPATAAHAREQAHAATRVLMIAEEAQLGDGVKSVEWERRGVFGRLVRKRRG